MKEKKPDNVVFNAAENKYDAALKPYATNIGAPAITTENLAPWKNKGVGMLNAAMASEYEEIRERYQKLQERFEYNSLVYSAKFSFQPMVGHTYHLYKNQQGAPFLSILAPQECNFDHVGSFRLGSDYVWERLKSTKAK